MKRRYFALVLIASVLLFAGCGAIDKITEISIEVTPDGTILRGSNLSGKLNWLDDNAESNNTYIIEIGNDQSISSRTLRYGDRNNITVILKGTRENRNINASGGNMFSVNYGVTFVLGENITLNGRLNRDYLVNINGGTFIMNIGSAITGNRHSAVYINSGTFEMTGGTINDNIADRGGGVFVGRNGTFNMTGGNITGNIAREYGGGVFIEREGTFVKTRGAITGFADDPNGNVVENNAGNTLTNRGHAVYLDNLSPRHRETTVTRTDSLSSNSIYGWDN